jgi:hypothetical protein
MHTHAPKPILRYLIAVMLLIPMAALAGSQAGDVTHARLVVETKSAFEAGDTLAFRFVGRVASHSRSPGHLVFDGDLTSLANGERAGSLTFDLTCGQIVGFPCGVYEVTSTFRLAGGTLVSRAMASVAADPTAPGFFHIGIHPADDSIIDATGIFADRSGTAQMSGRHGGQEFPAFVSFDDFWLIELSPRT